MRFTHLDRQGDFAPLPPVNYVTDYGMLFLDTINCPYSTASRYDGGVA